MIYLNQAATSYPKPQRVLDAHAEALSKIPSGQFRSSADETGSKDVFTECKENLGNLLGIKDIDRIFFSSGATASSNAIIYGLGLKDAHVITTATEHNSILRPLFNLKGEEGLVTVVPCDENGYVKIRDIEDALREDVKAVFINHCSNVTGMVQEIEEITRVVHKRGIPIIVDASQSAGCIPVNVDQWDVDGLIFTGHKSLFGAQGSGGHYVKKSLDLKPFMYGGTGYDSSRIEYDDSFYEFEVGTANMPGIIDLNAGVSYILDRSVKMIQTEERRKMRRLYDGLSLFKAVKVYGEFEKNIGPVLSFNIIGLRPSDVSYILQNAYGIIVRTGIHCAPFIHSCIGSGENGSGESGTVRISISDLTNDSDIDGFLEAVKDIAGSVDTL